jgi:hypothetical protein
MAKTHITGLSFFPAFAIPTSCFSTQEKVEHVDEDYRIATKPVRLLSTYTLSNRMEAKPLTPK